MSKKKKTKKWGKASFMRSWARVSAKGGWDPDADGYEVEMEQWLAFYNDMLDDCKDDGAVVPTEITVWNRIHHIEKKLKAGQSAPAYPNRPTKTTTEKPKTAAQIAAELGW